jgi:hypothetical protein
MVFDVATRVNKLFDYVCDSELRDECRMKPEDFTRNTPLNFVNLVLLFLSMSGLSNTMELVVFFEKIEGKVVDKSALTQARSKLKPLVFKKLNFYYLKMVYENEKSLKTFKKHLILAGDGSKLELPHHKALIKIFGGTKNKFKEFKSCMGNSSMIYDVLNKHIFDFKVDSYRTSEKVLIFRNLANLFKMNFLKDIPKIFIFDRGYRSIEFYHKLMKKEEKFVFRLRSNDYKKEKMKLRNNDQWINIEITKNRLNQMKDKKLKSELLDVGILNLRIITIKLVTGEIEYLITNLDKKEFKHTDIAEIYNLRWKIEVSLKTLKSLLKIENISGRTKIAVEQDILSQIVVHNMINDVENTSQDLKNKNNENSPFKKKREGKINTNIVIGYFKLKLVGIFIENDEKEQKKIISLIIIKLTRYYTNTSTKIYEHPKNTPPRKNPSNNRRSF